jgi:hypothetical protein
MGISVSACERGLALGLEERFTSQMALHFDREIQATPEDMEFLLFHVVNDRHLKKRPTIFTTNKPLSAWRKVLHDEDLAAAILDRVLERGRFIHLEGPSGRTGYRLDGQEHLPATADGARISGIDRPQFPEPTLVGCRL